MEFLLWRRRNIDSLTVGPSASRAAIVESTRAWSKPFFASSPNSILPLLASARASLIQANHTLAHHTFSTISLKKMQENSEGTTEIRVTLLSATRRSHL